MTMQLAERLLAATVVIAGVLGALRTVVARIPASFSPARARELAVIETAFLPNGASLHTIVAAERRFVIARSAAAFAVVCELAPAPTPATAPSSCSSHAIAPGHLGARDE